MRPLSRNQTLSPSPTDDTPGPFRAHHIPDGSDYELSEGHAIRCMSAGERHGSANARGAAVLETDPSVDGAGVDVGIEFNEGKNLRAPDIVIGTAEERPGWSHKVPPLVVEFADVGQNEKELQKKIKELHGLGTRYIWVVRLTGPRRVEVYEKGRRRRVVAAGRELLAPGVLHNPVPVLAFFERDAAHEVTLRNLLQRKGYASLEVLWAKAHDEGLAEGRTAGLAEGRTAGRTEGLAEGRTAGLAKGRSEGLAEGHREGILGLCEVLGIPVTPPRRSQLLRMDAAALQGLLSWVRRERRWPPRRQPGQEK